MRLGPGANCSSAGSAIDVLFYGSVVVGALALAASLWSLRTLLRGSAHQKEAMVEAVIAHVERAAPSGLRPLWVGLLVALVFFIVYVATAA